MRDQRGRGYGPDDEEDEQDRMRFLKGAGLVLLAFIFAGALFFAYRNSMHPAGLAGAAADGSPPLLRADTTPYKMAPENPGGIDIPHQDKEIYDRLSGKTEPGVERLLPRAEEPLDLPSEPQVQPNPDALAAASAGMSPTVEGSAPAVPTPPQGTMPVPGQMQPGAAMPATGAPVSAMPTETPGTDAPAGTVPASVADKVAGQKLPEPIAEGEYVVQLGSGKDEAGALRQFSRLQKKYPDLLGGLAPNVQRADLGDKGVFFRLRAGPLSKSAAELLCDKLSSGGQACLVKAK